MRGREFDSIAMACISQGPGSTGDLSVVKASILVAIWKREEKDWSKTGYQTKDVSRNKFLILSRIKDTSDASLK